MDLPDFLAIAATCLLTAAGATVSLTCGLAVAGAACAAGAWAIARAQPETPRLPANVDDDA